MRDTTIAIAKLNRPHVTNPEFETVDQALDWLKRRRIYLSSNLEALRANTPKMHDMNPTQLYLGMRQKWIDEDRDELIRINNRID